jgi:para-nitrobenzyl esterase
LVKAIGDRFGADRAAAIIAAQKAARPQDSNYLVQAATFTDASRGSATLVQAERKAALKRAPVWVHQWDFVSNMADGKFGAVHGIDVPPTFHNARDAMMENGSADGKRLSFRFSATWAAFAKTGNPNNPEIPNWPAYDAQKRSVLIWDREVRVVDDYRGELIRMLAQPAK